MAEHQQKQGVGPFSNPPNNPPLRLCPFCGEQEGLRATTGPVPNFWGVICDGCGCFLDCRANAESEAVALWNRRADERPSHAYRVGVAVGRAFPKPQAQAALDGEADREGYWREQAEVYRQRMEAAEAVQSTLSVHPSEGGKP